MAVPAVRLASLRLMPGADLGALVDRQAWGAGMHSQQAWPLACSTLHSSRTSHRSTRWDAERNASGCAVQRARMANLPSHPQFRA